MSNNNSNIILSLSANVIAVPEVTIDKVTLLRIVDSPSARSITAFLKEYPNPLILWKGVDYDNVGDWTQQEANARIIELLTS